LRLFGLFFELVLVIVLAPRRVASVLLELGNVANLFVRLLLLGLSSGVEAQVVLRLTVHRLNISISYHYPPLHQWIDSYQWKHLIIYSNHFVSYNFEDEINRAIPKYANIHQGKLKLDMKLLHIVENRPKTIVKLEPLDE
jgi:hypothetical protein